MKKFLFMATLLLSWLPFASIGAQNVAKIGSNEYATLQAALDAAKQAGGTQTINLIGNVSGETVTIQEVDNFKLTIDGQNKTVDAQIVVDGLRGNGGGIDNGASVTLQNIAFENNAAKDVIYAKSYPHDLTIQNCSYTGSSASLTNWFLNASGSGECLYKVTVKNVTVKSSRLIQVILSKEAVFENIVAIDNCYVGFNIKTSTSAGYDGTVLIKNCQITTDKYAFRDYSDGYDGTITLEDNTFISRSEASDEGVIVNRGGVNNSGQIKVVSGTYTGPIRVKNKEGVLAISGGTFSVDPSDYVAEDHSALPSGEGENTVWTVVEGNPVAQVNGVYYESIADAVTAANIGGVIEIIKAGDYSLPGIPKNVTIKGAVNGVEFSHLGTGNVASIPTGATFNNVTFKHINIRRRLMPDKCIVSAGMQKQIPHILTIIPKIVKTVIKRLAPRILIFADLIHD